MGKVMSGVAAVLLVIGSLIGSGQPAVDGRGNRWVSEYYVDEFYEDTTDMFIKNEELFIGTYSDVVYTSARLEVGVMVDKEDVAFMLYGEAGNRAVFDTEYSLTMRTEDKTDYALSGIQPEGSDRIYLSQDSREVFLDAMCSNRMVKIHMWGQYHDDYRFALESLNFAEEYQKLAG